MERRRNARLEINLRCRVSSLRIGAQPRMGITESMSRGDIMVTLEQEQTAPELPCVGDPMIVEIDLPANHAFGRKCMQCQTTVVRVSTSESGAPRLAMRIHKMRFQSCGESSAFSEKAADLIGQLLM